MGIQNIRVLALDDNRAFLQLITLLLKECGISNIHCASSYEDAMNLFLEEDPDICLLDIELSEKEADGIKFADEIRKTHPNLPIIFLTANYTEEYYQRTRYIKPSSFMNKELSRLKMRQAIDIALYHKELSSKQSNKISNQQTTALINHSSIFFKIGDAYKPIAIKEISYFFADNKLTFARVNKRNIPTTAQLKTLEEELAGEFLRVHKSYLVNINHIEAIFPADNTISILGETINMGHSYRKDLLSRIKLLK